VFLFGFEIYCKVIYNEYKLKCVNLFYQHQHDATLTVTCLINELIKIIKSMISMLWSDCTDYICYVYKIATRDASIDSIPSKFISLKEITKFNMT
jgi:hypothetical protein